MDVRIYRGISLVHTLEGICQSLLLSQLDLEDTTMEEFEDYEQARLMEQLSTLPDTRKPQTEQSKGFTGDENTVSTGLGNS